jgi:GH24 family phage-related lysozyme (muramidase)
MAGFMRQPQVINDPSAAPAAMRANDVDLQAQEGDFIMGYPAMQKSGTRVRSLIEQAMLKAKDAGVKTKGYKHGDKVDILVHNKEMHIPQELVPYIDGGYATLKKLNKPSKHDEGDTVIKEFAEPAKPMSNIPDVFAEPAKPIKNNNIKPFPVSDRHSGLNLIPAPTGGAIEFEDEYLGSKLWNQTNKKVKKIVNSKAFNKGKYINNMMHNETMTNLKNAVEKYGIPDTEKLLDTSFLFNAIAGTETNFLMDKANFATGSGRLNAEVKVKENGLEFRYPDGTPNLFGANQKAKQYYDRPERNLPGWDATYEQLADFLIQVEGFDATPRQDGKQWVIGHGHKITENDTELLEMLKQNGNITEDYANELLASDILRAQDDARTNYNKHTKSKTFDDLDYNSKMILMEKNYHLGRGRAGKYEKLSTAIKNGDWAAIAEESKAKQRISGKLEFTEGMKNRHNKFLEYFVTPFSMGI